MGLLGKLKTTARGPVAWGAVFGTYLILFLLGTYLYEIARSDRNRAIDEFCQQSETTHFRDVRGLKFTYEYIVGLTKDDLNNSLNRAVVLQVPKTEALAKKDTAPDICDETFNAGFLGLWDTTDYGRAEPDPKIPERPQAVDDALQYISDTSPSQPQQTPK